jgi:hypothetical protein
MYIFASELYTSITGITALVDKIDEQVFVQQLCECDSVKLQQYTAASDPHPCIGSGICIISQIQYTTPNSVNRTKCLTVTTQPPEKCQPEENNTSIPTETEESLEVWFYR